MDCNEARELLGADVDRELPAPDALRIQRHVDACDACRRERDRIVALSQAVRQADYHRAPDALRARIIAGLPAAQDTPRAATDRTVDELVASHVRAGLSARDIDVISTDRHTVKPWFNGRLDYAPPVEDLAASGFPLAGGRLDYVGQRRVAVLVYRYRQHVIDVYVRPSAEGGQAAPYATVSQGYAVDRWDAAGMTWWAVTDAEPSALAAFRTALNARLVAPRTE